MQSKAFDMDDSDDGSVADLDSNRAPAPMSAPVRHQSISDLRKQISRIEGVGTFARDERPTGRLWTLGAAALDARIGPLGLDAGGMHEVCSAAATHAQGAAAAAASRRVFGLLLGMRRIATLECASPMLWVLPTSVMQETGAPYSHGLSALGLDPARIIIVSPRKVQDVLWVMEEGMRSGCLSMVVGEIAGISTTASRRLSLAAAQAQCPCVLISTPGRMPARASASRWRVAPRLGGDDRFDAAAPGARRFTVGLERCRAQPILTQDLEFALEWSDGARGFSVVSPVSDRAFAPRSSRAQHGQHTQINRTA